MTAAGVAATGCLMLLVACGREAGDQPPDNSCFVGDSSSAMEFEVVYRTVQGEVERANEMGKIPLIQPPQGGKVLLVGVRARNLDPCSLIISTALVDPASDAVVALERRPI